MRFGGIVLATAFVLGACTSKPAPLEPSGPPPSASASPTITVPTPVAQVSEDTPEGAAAFVKHYVDVFNYAAATGDVEELSRLSSPDCGGCQSYITLYRDTYKAGGYFKGGDWKIGDFQVKPGEADTVLFAKVTSEAGTYVTESGSSPQPGNGENSDLTFVAKRTAQGWMLTTLELQAS